MIGGGGNPMMGGGGVPTTSTLPTLLGAWGVSFDSNEVLADAKYATHMAGDRVGAAVLTLLPKEAMPQKDNVITKDLTSVTFFLPGAFHITGGGGETVNTLIKSFDRAALVESFAASQLDPSLLTSRPNGESFGLLLHLTGNFKTAFPNGKPGSEAPETGR